MVTKIAQSKKKKRRHGLRRQDFLTKADRVFYP